MSKNLTIEQWVRIINVFKTEEILKAVTNYKKLKGKFIKYSYDTQKMIRIKANLLNNYGMKSLLRKSESDRPKNEMTLILPGIIDDLNEEQKKKKIIKDWIKIQRNKKDKNSLKCLITLNINIKARILKLHRTSFYKKQILRVYKLDYLKKIVGKILIDSKFIYGSRKIAILLGEEGITINDRNLRNYMIRWGFFIKRRRRSQELKNTSIKFVDLIKRNLNPEMDNIIETDVSYSWI
ncbi:hypothetical protein SLITO_v1c10420 [Spiroplasma litorale]|uniref:Uncharacterized protein n=1 Tax=Spiroplasma litorale TaxID=216942 RepID=A0A0K1W394_9MOLU|nr:hypothetical protein [Spiroplasma litorale]AKX34653.1 hypothetical protein SLITO_v1c10420 [Spiroplasma litorale]